MRKSLDILHVTLCIRKCEKQRFCRLLSPKCPYPSFRFTRITRSAPPRASQTIKKSHITKSTILSDWGGAFSVRPWLSSAEMELRWTFLDLTLLVFVSQ